MKLAQKQAYAKHRSNITNSRFETKKRNFAKKRKKINFLRQIPQFFYMKRSLKYPLHYLKQSL